MNTPTPTTDVADDLALLGAIALRVESLQLIPKGSPNFRHASDWLLVFAFCHTEVCPLHLAGLLAAPDRDFMSDCFGIVMNLNRRDRTLMNFYRPRYALEVAPKIQ